ncbi:MAG: serine hydrolase [Pseudomonadota bacterium]
MTPRDLSRRTALSGLAATLASPAISVTVPAMERVADTARGFDQLHGLIVQKDGIRLVEEHLRGPELDRPANVKSVSKTIVAALLGVAIDRQVVPGLQATIGDVAPQLIPASADARAADITLEDLVTLRAGLERTSGPNYGEWVSSSNWVADALSRPFLTDPGARMLYSTGSTHILGAVLAEATDQSLLNLARDWLGAPLAIEIPAWTRDPQGYYLGGNEMALSPEAMIRFAEMFAAKGTWNDTQVISEGYTADALVARTFSPFSGLSYGLGWFLGQSDGARVALARGYGGQVIAIVPDRGLAIAITSDPTRPARSGGYFGDLLGLIDQIIQTA